MCGVRCPLMALSGNCAAFDPKRTLLSTELRRVDRCQLSAVPASSAGAVNALPDLPHHRVHIGEVPNLRELAVFDAIKSELRNSHPTTGRLNSLEGPSVGTGDREVHRDIVAVDNDVSYFPTPVRKCGDQRANCAVTAAGSIGTSLTLMVDV